MEAIRKYLAALKHILIAAPVLLTLLGVLHFPYDVDAPLTQQEIAAAQKYYADAYRAPVSEGEQQPNTKRNIFASPRQPQKVFELKSR